MSEDRRRFKRLPKEAILEFSVIEESDPTAAPENFRLGGLRDLSLGGTGVIVNESLRVGCHVSLKVYVEPLLQGRKAEECETRFVAEGRVLELLCKVVWSEGDELRGYQSGLRLVWVEKKDVEIARGLLGPHESG